MAKTYLESLEVGPLWFIVRFTLAKRTNLVQAEVTLEEDRFLPFLLRVERRKSSGDLVRMEKKERSVASYAEAVEALEEELRSVLMEAVPEKTLVWKLIGRMGFFNE